MDLTDEQWSIIQQPLIPDLPRCSDGKGKPWKDSREIMNGVLWILRTGAPWHDLPERYPPYQTCHHRRFQQWVHSSGVFEHILQALATDYLRERGGGIDLSECYIDGTFIVAKRGGEEVGEATKRGKGTKEVMTIISDSAGLPAVAIHIASTASPHEVTTLAETTLSKCFVSNEKTRAPCRR